MIGLSKVHKNNTEIGNFLKYLFGLPFLKSDEVRTVLLTILYQFYPRIKEHSIISDYILLNTYLKPDCG